MKLGFSEKVRARTLSNIIVLAAGIGMILLVFRFGAIMKVISHILNAFFPFLLGCVIAFMLTPMVNRLDVLLKPFLCRRMMRRKLLRISSILISYTVMILVISGFIAVLVPQLITSVRSITSMVATYLPAHADEINAYITDFGEMIGNPDLMKNIEKIINDGIGQILSYSNVLVTNIMFITMSISNFVVQIFIALIAGFYLLFDKENFATKGKKIMFAFLPRKLVKLQVFWLRKTQAIFSGFITGKIIDSLIIGALCYVLMLVLRIDYTLLISVVIGFTNLLPFFGPFIGAIPSVIILLMINPVQALKFAVMVLVLQQIDGNIIGPRVLGNSLGIAPFWIMVAIVVGSALFGFAGMVLGAPVFAVFYAILETIIDYNLQKKNLPTDTARYKDDAVADDIPEPDETEA